MAQSDSAVEKAAGYKILSKEILSDVTKLMVVEVPQVAAKAKAGQFVIVRIDEKGERIPLTIADYDREGRDDHHDLPGSGQIDHGNGETECRRQAFNLCRPSRPSYGDREFRHRHLYGRRRRHCSDLPHSPVA